jgi:hypothetical protein
LNDPPPRPVKGRIAGVVPGAKTTPRAMDPTNWQTPQGGR